MICWRDGRLVTHLPGVHLVREQSPHYDRAGVGGDL